MNLLVTSSTCERRREEEEEEEEEGLGDGASCDFTSTDRRRPHRQQGDKYDYYYNIYSSTKPVCFQ